MENKKERVLAYSMAKLITKEALSDVSGGKRPGCHYCKRGTLGGSAGSGQPTEAHVDVVLDFDW